MLEFSPTPEQSAVVAAIPLPESQMIEAMAGTAKTTTLRLAAAKVRKPALALAFNKKIAQELTETFPRNFSCRSLNSHGFAAIRRANPQRAKWDVDGSKLAKLIKQVVRASGIQLGSEEYSQLRSLVSSAMSLGITPHDQGTPLTPDEPRIWSELCLQAWIEEDARATLIELAHGVLEANLDAFSQGHISFDDQIYLPLVLGLPFPRFPIIFGDEVQDWNALNHEMVRRSLAPEGKLVLAGDSRQSIYAFRGACSDSMQRARALAPRWLDQTLTLTFRCPKAIVERQQRHAPGYRAAETNSEGRVIIFGEHANKADETDPNWTIDDLLSWSPSSPPAVLCRNNAPLLSLAFKLIRQRVSVAMLGRDIGKGLIALSKKLAKKDDMPADLVRSKISEWRASELELLRANEAEESRFDAINDRAECLLAVLDSADVPTAGTLRAALEDLFSREGGRIQLATIHRSKGLEWQTVMHLDPWRVPSKQARKRGGDALQQELNLQYVAETRAREVLVLGNLEDFT